MHKYSKIMVLPGVAWPSLTKQGKVSGVYQYILNVQYIFFCRLDDPTQAVSVHLVPGFWGAIAVPLFSFTGKLRLLLLAGCL
jgi:ammonia channel protein AmtB